MSTAKHPDSEVHTSSTTDPTTSTSASITSASTGSTSKAIRWRLLCSCIFYPVAYLFWLIVAGYLLVLFVGWLNGPPEFLTRSIAQFTDTVKSITGMGNTFDESRQEIVTVIKRVELRNDQGVVHHYDPGAMLSVLNDREGTLQLGGSWAHGQFEFQGEVPKASVISAPEMLDLLTGVVDELEQQYELSRLVPTPAFPLPSASHAVFDIHSTRNRLAFAYFLRARYYPLDSADEAIRDCERSMHYGGSEGVLTLEIASIYRRNKDYPKYAEYFGKHQRLTVSYLDAEFVSACFRWFQWLLMTNANTDLNDDDEAFRFGNHSIRRSFDGVRIA